MAEAEIMKLFFPSSVRLWGTEQIIADTRLVIWDNDAHNSKLTFCGSNVWLIDLHTHLYFCPDTKFFLVPSSFSTSTSTHTSTHTVISAAVLFWHELPIGAGRCQSNVPIKMEMMNSLSSRKCLTGQQPAQPPNSAWRWHFQSVNKPHHSAANTWFISICMSVTFPLQKL